MKPAACEYCGAAYHQPWDDGLVECRQRLYATLDALRDVIVYAADDCLGLQPVGEDPEILVNRVARWGHEHRVARMAAEAKLRDAEERVERETIAKVVAYLRRARQAIMHIPPSDAREAEDAKMICGVLGDAYEAIERGEWRKGGGDG